MAHPELLQSFLQEAEEVMLQLESGVQALCADGRATTSFLLASSSDTFFRSPLRPLPYPMEAPHR